MTDRIKGVIAAVPSPLAANARAAAPAIDTDRFVQHARWALDHGCDGLNVLGSTGEANSFSPEARAALMRAAAGALPVGRMMVGTGAPDLETAIRLTALAGSLGFTGALVLPPYYYSAVSDDGLFAFFERLIAETAAEAPPIYLYNFPQMTGLNFAPELVARLRAAYPDRVLGIKDSSGDLDYAAQLAGIEGLDVFPSSESALGQADAKGFAGVISATVNLSAPLAQRVWRAQDDATALGQLSHIRETVSARPLIPAVKHLVGRRLGDEAWDALLPPFLPLSQADRAALAPVADELRAL
ncbi:dihydrodipicolinate synthase family protein [Alkalilacustris brevis]|uniref:dihydrodipicolinate synthase family protein n=1 Tax=Alkalilacustris brevis TaxID=2026338 RepID=UPI000E0DFCE0|nr:dihydrodipicolinate synthase family protein [Alkalilacustris brevis]